MDAFWLAVNEYIDGLGRAFLIGVVVCVGFIIAITVSRILQWMWSWINRNDDYIPNRVVLIAAWCFGYKRVGATQIKGFTVTSDDPKRFYDATGANMSVDDVGMVLALFSIGGTFLFYSMYMLWELSLVIVLIVAIAHLARFSCDQAKLFTKHCKDVDAHKKN